MTVSAPAAILASRVAVSGSVRSMKKRPATSLASMRSATPFPSALFATAALAILPHI